MESRKKVKNGIMDKKNCVYRFRNSVNEIVYVGKCMNLSQRLLTHKYNHHLPIDAYIETKAVDYISYPSYADAGIMEKAYIAYFQPKYNIQFTKEGPVTVLQEDVLSTQQWSLFQRFPEGIPIKNILSTQKRFGVLAKADFCIYDGEGVCGEVYFIKILKSNNKPKTLKIIGSYKTFYENNACDEKSLQEYIELCTKECEKCTEFPMKFLREEIFNKKLRGILDETHMPIAYKGTNKVHIEDEKYNIRYDFIYKTDDWNATFWSFTRAVALEVMTLNKEIDEVDYECFLRRA